MPDIPFADRPWQDILPRDLAVAAHVPTMISEDEQALYYWLTRHWAAGEGAVVDLGAFVGGSTARLAAGWQAAGHSRTIHAFDRFTAKDKTKERQLFRKGIPRFDGTDILPLAQDLLAPFAPLIRFWRGEIAQIDWPPEPIEILVEDAGKSPAAIEAHAAKFFPHMIPGRSVLVHQDFLHRRVPWQPVFMAGLTRFFRPVSRCGGAGMVFLCTAVPDEGALQGARCSQLDDAGLIDGLGRAERTYADLVPARRFAEQADAVRRNPGKRISWQMTS